MHYNFLSTSLPLVQSPVYDYLALGEARLANQHCTLPVKMKTRQGRV